MTGQEQFEAWYSDKYGVPLETLQKMLSVPALHGKHKDAKDAWDAATAAATDKMAFNLGLASRAPEGFVLVPVEPTGAMVKAGSWNDYAHSLPDNHVIEIYKAMIVVQAIKAALECQTSCELNFGVSND